MRIDYFRGDAGAMSTVSAKIVASINYIESRLMNRRNKSGYKVRRRLYSIINIQWILYLALLTGHRCNYEGETIALYHR